MRRAVRMIRHAISPRLAMSTLSNTAWNVADEWGSGNGPLTNLHTRNVGPKLLRRMLDPVAAMERLGDGEDHDATTDDHAKDKQAMKAQDLKAGSREVSVAGTHGGCK